MHPRAVNISGAQTQIGCEVHSLARETNYPSAMASRRETTVAQHRDCPCCGAKYSGCTYIPRLRKNIFFVYPDYRQETRFIY